MPPALTHYMGREIAQTMHFAGAPWLTRESRDREEEPAKLMAALHLKPGMTVCDLGCGNGFYTLKLAEAVGPTGKILAVDIQKEMLDMLNKRSAKAGVKNIVPILGDEADPRLPDGVVDLMLIVDTYHEIDRPVEMLAAIRKSLSKTGRMVLVEFRAEDVNVPIKILHKMSKAQINKEIPANGFKLVEQFDGLPWQHVMFFERDDTWKGPAPRE
jgi:ubiquinone/menaquinone biosynthesis C-methylase UbiE